MRVERHSDLRFGEGRPGRRRKPGGASGFTFAEVLAAMLFLAILVPVVVEGIALASRAAVVSERSGVALQLADRELNELIVNGTWSSANSRGTFGDEWPGFSWELTRGTWREDDMTELTLAVLFEVQGRPYTVRLSTLVDDSAL
jgi:hypothetical protein